MTRWCAVFCAAQQAAVGGPPDRTCRLVGHRQRDVPPRRRHGGTHARESNARCRGSTTSSGGCRRSRRTFPSRCRAHSRRETPGTGYPWIVVGPLVDRGRQRVRRCGSTTSPRQRETSPGSSTALQHIDTGGRATVAAGTPRRTARRPRTTDAPSHRGRTRPRRRAAVTGSVGGGVATAGVGSRPGLVPRRHRTGQPARARRPDPSGHRLRLHRSRRSGVRPRRRVGSVRRATTRRCSGKRSNVDDATWDRGRGWALCTALWALPYYLHTNPRDGRPSPTQARRGARGHALTWANTGDPPGMSHPLAMMTHMTALVIAAGIVAVAALVVGGRRHL